MTAVPTAAGQPGCDDLTTRIFRALYQNFTLHTINGIYIVVPKGIPCFTSSSLGEIARQISEYEHPHKDQPPGGPPTDPRQPEAIEVKDLRRVPAELAVKFKAPTSQKGAWHTSLTRHRHLTHVPID